MNPDPSPPDLLAEAARRRTFAIISHPDAGKTTLTEKFLLYAGAVQRSRRRARPARGGGRRRRDWMELEQQRGISISSTVLQFPYRDHVVNLLDTPGHRDFSEDTYRVLAAVDAVVMVLDAAKGIEAADAQAVRGLPRSRDLPVLTFLNKYDRPGREPLELLDEIEQQIGLRPTPATWPVGMRRRLPRRDRPPHRCSSPGSPAPPAARQLAAGGDRARRRRQPPPRRARPGRTARSTRSRAARRGRRRRRPDVVPRRRVDAGVRRLGADQLRRAHAARRASSTSRPSPSPRLDDDGAAAPARQPLLGVRVQGPGQHGPGAPRPHRLRPHLLGPLRARHERHPRPHRPRAHHQVRHHGVRGRPRDRSTRRSPATWSASSTPPAAARRHAVRRRRTPVDVPADPAVLARGLRHGPPARQRARSSSSARDSRSSTRRASCRCCAIPTSATSNPILAAVGELQFEVFAYRLASEFGAPAEILSAGVPGDPAAPTRRRRPRLRDIGGIRILRRVRRRARRPVREPLPPRNASRATSPSSPSSRSSPAP